MFFTLLKRSVSHFAGVFLLKPRSGIAIYCINNESDRRLISENFLNNYYVNPEIKTITIEQVSFFKILFRRIKLLTIPKKQLCKTKASRLKRKLIKVLGLCIAYKIKLYQHVDILYEKHQCNKMFSFPNYLTEIYSFNFDKFSVENLWSITLATNKTFFNFVLYMLAWFKSPVDLSHGAVVFVNVTQFYWVRAYKRLHPNKNIIIRFHDSLFFNQLDAKKVKKDLDFLLKKKIIVRAETYSREDAVVLGIVYQPNGVNFEKFENLKKSYSSYIYSFIGVENKAQNHRHKYLMDIKDQLSKIYTGIDCHINEYLLTPGNVERAYLPYKKYLDILSESEIVVDFVKVSQNEGISFRIVEGLLLGKKVITDRLAVLNETFYDPNKIFIIGYDRLDRLKDFIEQNINNFTIDPSLNVDAWWNEYIS